MRQPGTRFGNRPIPFFRVLKWHEGGIAEEEPRQIEHQTNKYAEAKGKVPILNRLEEPSVREELDDEIPF